MGQLIVIILELGIQIINLYQFVVLGSVIMSWLVGFGVINGYNPTVRTIWDFLRALTEPLLRPIRRILPDLGAIDISPIVLLLGCWVAIRIIAEVLIPNVRAIGI